MIVKNNRKIKLFFLSLLYVLAVSVGFSQNIKFKRLSIDEGLSAVTVNAIFQDSQDFIWIGTQDGLNRYDGYHFKTFKNDPFNQKSISSNDVKCIFEDNSGVMYLGSNGGGFSIYNKYTETFLNHRTGLGSNTISNNIVNDITDINNDELLVATDNGVNIYNKVSKTFKQINYRDTAISFTKFFKDSYGTIWVGSESNYIFEFIVSENKLKNYELPQQFLEFDKLNKDVGARRRKIFDFIQNKDDLVCGTDGGLLFFDISTKTFRKVFSFEEKNRYNNRIKCFVNTSDSTKLIFGTWGGFFKLNLKDF